MTASRNRDRNPNATIQVSLDELQLAELEARFEQENAAPAPRTGPPALPPQLPVALPAAVASPITRPPQAQEAPGTVKKIAYGVMLVSLVAAAVAAGLRVGDATRPQAGMAGVSSTSSPAQRGVPTPPESVSGRVLTLPTIEMH